MPVAQSQTKSFLKWAGGKYRLLDKILPCLPNGNRLIEPFVGSGAVFLNTDYQHYLLNDVNNDLITLYKILIKQPATFITYAQSFFTVKNNTAQHYYQLRQKFNLSLDPMERSALFIYLNRHGYNGLCRYNLKGEFNVPFGQYKKPHFPEIQLLAFVTKAKHAKFTQQPFEKIMLQAKVGDIVYCDPPYVPLSTSANFTQYSMRKFTQQDQEHLAELAITLASQNIPVIISNHNTQFTRRIYERAQFKKFSATRLISCHGATRQPAKELLAIFR